MGADAPERGQPGRHRLVAAVHRDQGQVHVDDEVRFRRASVQRDLLVLRRLADIDVVLGVFAVVLVEAVGMKRRKDALADDVAQLVFSHSPVQAQRRDDVQVVDAGLGCHVNDLFHHELAHVGRGHRRQRQGQVVEGDRQLHPASQERFERIVLQRFGDRAFDGTLGMRDRFERVGRIDDARAQRHLLQPDALPEVEEHRRRVAIDLDHGSGTGHQALNRRRSNATFTAPRRPALIA